MKIGVVGARVAGSYAALLLSSQGNEVVLLDSGMPGEKACGGGLTAKGHRLMPWLEKLEVPHNEIREVELGTCENGSAFLPLRHSIQIFSRTLLDNALRNAAIQAGARFYAERARRFERRRDGWCITTTSGTRHEVDFLIGADGVKSAVRSILATRLPAEDLSLALGYFLPGIHHPGRILVSFQEQGFQGYIWSFPRTDHSSTGIIHRLPGARAADMHRRIASFIVDHYGARHASAGRFFSALVPCLRCSTLIGQRVCGPDWALLGDAAGFVDALTSEGIYFAFRSAQLLADALRDCRPETFEERWRSDFGAALERAAAWYDGFYTGSFMSRPFTARTVRMIRDSATVRQIADGVICGRQTYDEMRSGLIARSPRILVEALWELMRERSR